MKFQNSQFYLFRKIKSMPRILFFILFITTKSLIYSQQPCVTNSGPSTEKGLHTWCWNNVALPTGYNGDYEAFSGGDLGVSSHSNVNMVTQSGNRLYFKVNPTTPAAQPWSNSNYNYRAEIRDTPSNTYHPLGTEQWFGFNYRFESDYIIDTANEWLFWQVHAGSGSPPVAIQVRPAKDDNADGMLYFVNHAVYETSPVDYTPLGVVPTANTSLDIVIHLVSETDSTGLVQIWINGSLVYDEYVKTCYTAQAYGGYVKWGIYKWPWKNTSAVNASANVGVTELNTSMGALRTLKRDTDDPDYLEDAYSLVSPDGSSNPSGSDVNAESVSVTPSTYELTNGSTTQLTATLSPTNATDQTGLWSSSNSYVATVTSSGLVTSVSEGQAIITFTANDRGFSDSATITVTNL
jgi:hypothetical protein